VLYRQVSKGLLALKFLEALNLSGSMVLKTSVVWRAEAATLLALLVVAMATLLEALVVATPQRWVLSALELPGCYFATASVVVFPKPCACFQQSSASALQKVQASEVGTELLRMGTLWLETVPLLRKPAQLMFGLLHLRI
jgi:hypothetical protein